MLSSPLCQLDDAHPEHFMPGHPRPSKVSRVPMQPCIGIANCIGIGIANGMPLLIINLQCSEETPVTFTM